MADSLTAERLRELLDYDPATGFFTWRVNGRGRYKRVGAIAGWHDTNGRVRIGIEGILHHASRLAVLYMTGYWPNQTIDHANGDCADNRWRNLRFANQTQQNANQKLRSDNSTGFKGTSFCRWTGRYSANIGVGGHLIWLGRFDTAEQAHAAYCAAAHKYFGEFARIK